MDKADAIRLHRVYYALGHVKKIKAVLRYSGRSATLRVVTSVHLRRGKRARRVKIFRPSEAIGGRKGENERNGNSTIVVRR